MRKVKKCNNNVEFLLYNAESTGTIRPISVVQVQVQAQVQARVQVQVQIGTDVGVTRNQEAQDPRANERLRDRDIDIGRSGGNQEGQENRRESS